MISNSTNSVTEKQALNILEAFCEARPSDRTYTVLCKHYYDSDSSFYTAHILFGGDHVHQYDVINVRTKKLKKYKSRSTVFDLYSNDDDCIFKTISSHSCFFGNK